MKKHWMASLVVLLCCCFVAACDKGVDDGWKEYKYRDDGFAISAPSMPVPRTYSGATAAERQNSRAWGIDFGNRTEILITLGLVSDFGENVPAEEMLQRMKNMTLQGVPAKLVSERQLSLADNPGIEFEFQAERWHSRQRVYIVKDKLLGVSSTARGSEPLPPATDRIFDSLRLLK
ncbi:MAG TPA: hypothetical protein VIX11_02385 [Candidatus Acidoferrum sp.]|jgi:hypothetical protein